MGALPLRLSIAAAGFLAAALGLWAGDASGERRLIVASPKDGAVIRSAFVTVAGAAQAGRCVRVAVDAGPDRNTCADSSGHFDLLIRAERGSHTLRVTAADAPDSSPVTVPVQINPPHGAPLAAARWDLLREGDIILSRSGESPQIMLYQPRYTHAALYLGAGSDGAAAVAEAVSEETAEGLGEVRSVPIEQTLAFHATQKVDFFRLKGGLNPQEREAILRFAGGTVNRGLKFWTASDDFGAIYNVWLQWDQQHDRPFNEAAFKKALDGLRSRMFSDQRFNCTTLVWRAYWEGSKGRIDLADPNRMGLGGQLARAFSAAFLNRVLPDFITPD